MYEHDKQTQPLSEKNDIIQPANRPFDFWYSYLQWLTIVTL